MLGEMIRARSGRVKVMATRVAVSPRNRHLLADEIAIVSFIPSREVAHCVGFLPGSGQSVDVLASTRGFGIERNQKRERNKERVNRQRDKDIKKYLVKTDGSMI